MQADGAVRKAGRDRVAIALEGDQAGGRHPLAVFDKAIEGCGQRHQCGLLGFPDVGEAARQAAMRGLTPQCLAPVLKPHIQRIKIRKGWHHLPESVARIANVLLDLSFLPTRRRVAEISLKDVVAGHGHEPRIHVALLAHAHAIHRRLHVVVDPAARHALEDLERVPMRVEQHLVGLQQIGPDQERPAMRQLDVSHLQLDALAADMGPVLAPVELERLARLEHKRHECPAIRRLLRALPVSFPGPHEGRDPLIRAVIAKLNQISVHLLGGAPVLARLALLGHQPA